jgi:hypothetical protein
MSEKKEKTICGKTKGEIREAYFKNKVKDLLLEIQGAKEWPEKDIKILGLELESLRTGDKKFINEVCEVFGGKLLEGEAKPPTLEELQAGISNKEWREKADMAAKYIKEILDDTRIKIADKTPNKKPLPQSFWLDTSTIFLSYLDLIDKDIIYKNQKYHAKIIQIMTDHELTRKASEDFAKTTVEYSEYKNVEKLKERILEFINLAKYYDRRN